MSENEKNETPVDSAPQVSPTEAINQLKDLFSTLVPPETLEIQDAFGNTHLTRASIPARMIPSLLVEPMLTFASGLSSFYPCVTLHDNYPKDSIRHARSRSTRAVSRHL